MSFDLPDLDYNYADLSPHIDEQTMGVHHKGHHQTYVDKLNAALGDHSKDLVHLQTIMVHEPTAVRNNGGGHYNHSMFWKIMAPPGTSIPTPGGELGGLIDKSFGSFEAMKTQFNQAAADRFGSGWAWLGVRSDGTLGITSTPNQDNPLMKGLVDDPMIPILGLDVWEHAYYLKYQNKRAEYINQWWNVVNWDRVVEYYRDYAKHGKPVSFLK